MGRIDDADRGRPGTRTLTRRVLLCTLLARQHLLDRTAMPIPEALEQVGGLQTQYAPSGYVGLWTRVAGFERSTLTRALEDGTVIQASLLRTTIHLVSRRDFWPYALGVRQARRDSALRTAGSVAALEGEASMIERAERLRRALADGPKTVKELGEDAVGFVGSLGLWVDLVRVPPSGTWERRRADRLALAETWVGPEEGSAEAGQVHLARAYLRAFGPASWRDIASWAGIDVSDARRGGDGLRLSTFRAEDGTELVDLAELDRADADVPAPVRFLPHWDATLLAHARRTGLLPEAFRPRVFSIKNPFSVGTYLVDGVVAGAWSVRDGRVVLDPFTELGARDRRAVEREREALEAFHR